MQLVYNLRLKCNKLHNLYAYTYDILSVNDQLYTI